MPRQGAGVRIIRLGLSFGVIGIDQRASVAERPVVLPPESERSAIWPEQLLLFANELRTRAKEILVRAASTDDSEAQVKMRVVAAGYEKLARRIEQRIREAVEA